MGNVISRYRNMSVLSQLLVTGYQLITPDLFSNGHGDVNIYHLKYSGGAKAALIVMVTLILAVTNSRKDMGKWRSGFLESLNSVTNRRQHLFV